MKPTRRRRNGGLAVEAKARRHPPSQLVPSLRGSTGSAPSPTSESGEPLRPRVSDFPPLHPLHSAFGGSPDPLVSSHPRGPESRQGSQPGGSAGGVFPRGDVTSRRVTLHGDHTFEVREVLHHPRRRRAPAPELEREFTDAHFNLARLFEQAGRQEAAVRHLREYQKLSECAPS